MVGHDRNDIVPEEVVDRHCKQNGVGIVVFEVEEDLDPEHDDSSTGKLH